jgi:hypothetical protein
MFSGFGLMIFLYYFTASLVLKVPPDVLAKIPFELEPAVRMFWLIGLMPTLSGVGHIIGGLLIRPEPEPARVMEEHPETQPSFNGKRTSQPVPASITERTTNLLDSR